MREPLLGVAIGRKGVGKSFTTDKVIANYVSGNPASGILGRKALILDVNDEYTHIRAIAIRELNKIRVGYKNQMVQIFGEGFEDIKMNHASV